MSLLIFADTLSVEGEPDLCLSQEPDGHACEMLREEARGKDQAVRARRLERKKQTRNRQREMRTRERLRPQSF